MRIPKKNNQQKIKHMQKNPSLLSPLGGLLDCFWEGRGPALASRGVDILTSEVLTF